MIYMSNEQVAHLVRDQVVAGSNPVTPIDFKPCKSLIYNDLQGFLILCLQMMYFRFFCAIAGFAANYSDNIPTNI
jgi:hypothetical protein